MDLDESEALGGDQYPYESSGSAFEISDDEQSHDEDAKQKPTSRAGSERGRRRSVPKSHSKKSRKAGTASIQHGSESPKQEVFEDALEWASTFKAPKVEEIKTPSRLSRGGRKRKAPKPPTEIRVKRLKAYYNNEYRELLNSEIQDAASRVINSDRLRDSQVGSSIWTATEKAVLFKALGTLGRDDVFGIAERIGSKSQHQVQEYVNLLRQGVMERKQNIYQILAPTDFSAAVEISEECCVILERAGEALAVHQELAEEKVEKGKWGDSWLINADVALQMDKKRKQESGEEEMEEVLPAANLLNLSNWIELSTQVFMNPGSPHEEDNWQTIAEQGEDPAVRATAFEDFHSLAYNLTKRLVSTTLFCSMSRLRAKSAHKIKYAEVNANDVEAAINILNLKHDSHDFWIGVAKRCSLHVTNDDDTDSDEPVEMSYTEVEKALRERQPRNRSRSMSQTRSRVRSEQPELITPTTEQRKDTDPEVDDNNTDSESDSEYTSLPDSNEEFMSSPPPPESSTSDPEPTSGDRPTQSQSHSHQHHTMPMTQLALEATQDAHIEACDAYASQTEEIRLWNLLHQTAPFEFTLAPVHEKAPKTVRDELVERENWRDYVGYVNEWEMMERPILEDEFGRNRKRGERMARRRAERVEEEGDVDADGEEDE